MDWVPKENVTQDLVDTWKEEKDERDAKKGGESFCSAFCSVLFYVRDFGVENVQLPPPIITFIFLRLLCWLPDSVLTHLSTT